MPLTGYQVSGQPDSVVTPNPLSKRKQIANIMPAVHSSRRDGTNPFGCCRLKLMIRVCCANREDRFAACYSAVASLVAVFQLDPQGLRKAMADLVSGRSHE